MSSLRAGPFIAPTLLVAFVCSAAALMPGHGVSGSVGRLTLAPWTGSEAAVGWRTLDRLVERAPLTDSGNLIIDARTAAALEASSEGLTPALPADTQARIRFLLQQGLTLEAGDKLADLLFRFTGYREARRHLSSVTTLTELEHLQAAHFGRSIAHALFHQQNTMHRAMSGNNSDAASLGQGTR